MITSFKKNINTFNLVITLELKIKNLVYHWVIIFNINLLVGILIIDFL
jgi:hypothetical protein